MSTAATILSVVLGAAFLGAGGTKLANVGPHEAEFERYRLPALPAQTARMAVGMVELLAALLLIVGAIASSSGVAVVGAVIVILAMLGALGTHLRLGDKPPQMAPAALLAVVAVLVLVLA
ncbi:MAG: DoxX family protein [Actinomycetota bacterium]|nr:DoxX family protein [Actinomycetota bacterium]